MSTYHIKIHTDNAAFDDPRESARILRDLASYAEDHGGDLPTGTLQDRNGNNVGRVERVDDGTEGQDRESYVPDPLPNLLNALELAEGFIDAETDWEDHPDDRYVMEQIRRAIADAEREAT